ncbi:MAG: tryptophan 2,3-dioxygenase [Armatimonadetes bacterium]|nr:tryptophan 2,3-dioxygenase [Armatimonadota bacterium]
MARRELEPTVTADLKDELDYHEYLHLTTLLSAQEPLSSPAHHDELLFIIQHQTSELWMKLVVHELQAAIEWIQQDQLEPCFKVLARVKQVQRMLFEQWAVLETLTPSEYMKFRGVLGRSSGFQSHQYRMIEFLLGAKDDQMLRFFKHRPTEYASLQRALVSPSLYDEFLRYLQRSGLPIPADRVNRDWSQPYEAHPGVTAALANIYEDPAKYWGAYEMAEKLVDVEEMFSLWRFRHMKTVERIIGFKQGTGGSSGVPFLQKVVFSRLFPELWDVRTEIR